MDKKISITAVVLSIIAIIIAIWAINKPSLSTPISMESTFDKVLKDDKLTICYATWPPSVIKDPNTGDLSGFFIEAIEMIAEDAEIELALTESTWGGFSADINTGKCDAGIAGFYPLINRSTAISFTRPFYYAGNNGVARVDDDRFSTIGDLNTPDIKIAVIQGEFAHVYAKKYLPNAQLVVLEESADNTAPLVAVTSSQADVGLIMDDIVNEYTKVHPEVKKLFTEPYSVTPISWVTRKDDQQLYNFLTNAINYLEATGELDTLAKKYSSTWYTEKKDYQIIGQ